MGCSSSTSGPQAEGDNGNSQGKPMAGSRQSPAQAENGKLEDQDGKDAGADGGSEEDAEDPPPQEPADHHSGEEVNAEPRYETFAELEEGDVIYVNSKNQEDSIGGRDTNYLDVRNGSQSNATVSRPEVPAGALWEDPDFSPDSALGDEIRTSQKLEWKRPHEIEPNAVLFAESATRFDIDQGSLGNCWFLSVLAALADKSGIIRQIIPVETNYLGYEGYDGVFHCRLWRFGQWYDVYIDDRLPCDQWGRIWGARNRESKEEMWPALMEKAFAKHNGSYSAIWGGFSGDAYSMLTGGVYEKIESVDKVSGDVLFQRLKNALASNCVNTVNVKSQYNDYQGLIINHSYTLNGIGMAKNKSGRHKLVRIRNPWGSGTGEWKGAWSDSAPEWKTVSSSNKKLLDFKDRDDGEFWISLEDFQKYFHTLCICSLTPDFDEDGMKDGLEKTSVIYCEHDARKKERMQNMFEFSLDKGDQSQPMVVQVIQNMGDRDPKATMLLRLYKIEAKADNDPRILISDRTTDTTFWISQNQTWRYKITPGSSYIVALDVKDQPSKPAHIRQYCIRVFLPNSINCRELNEDSKFCTLRMKDKFQKHSLSVVSNFAGAFIAGETAWGQRGARDTRGHYTPWRENPHFIIAVPSSQYIGVGYGQEHPRVEVPMGVMIFELRSYSKEPLSSKKHRRTGDVIQPADKEPNFIQGSDDVFGYFKLTEGNYGVLLHTNQQNEVFKFFAQIRSETEIDIVPHFLNGKK